jgi:NAD-dependent deacetylase
VRLEEVATREAFARDPARVQAFYNSRRRLLQLSSVIPNAAHEALANLEAMRPGEVMIATQNIDDLHERTGSRTVVHMHGELLKARCVACGKVTVWYDDLTGSEDCPICAIEGQLRPHVVWFGEMPLGLDTVYQVLTPMQGIPIDRHFSIGTSGSVEPAASFVEEARRAGAHTVELNLEPAQSASLFVERIYGPGTQIVPEFVARLLGGQ